MDETNPESRNEPSSFGHERGEFDEPPSQPSNEEILLEINMGLQDAESCIPPDEETIAKILNSRALTHARLGNGAAAVADIQRSIEWFESSKPYDHLTIARLYATRAEAFAVVGDAAAGHDALTAAIDRLDEAVGAEPYELPACHFRRGCIRYKLGQYPEALADIRKYEEWLESAETPNPNELANAHLWLGATCFGMGDSRGADAALSKFCAWADQLPVSERLQYFNYYCTLSEARCSLGDRIAMLEAATKIIGLLEEMPECSEVTLALWYAHRSDIHWRLGALDGAAKDIDRAFLAVRDEQIADPHTIAHRYLIRGHVRRATKDFAGAEADYTDAIRRSESPGQSQSSVLFPALCKRANARYRLGDWRGARADSIRAIEEYQRSTPGGSAAPLANCYYGLAYICSAAGDLPAAEEYVNQAISAARHLSAAPGSTWADTLVRLEALRTSIIERKSLA